MKIIKNLTKNDIVLKEFPKDIRFKYEWRKYQKRVLDDLQEYLGDNHLHIIAPPGSGKSREIGRASCRERV